MTKKGFFEELCASSFKHRLLGTQKSYLSTCGTISEDIFTDMFTVISRTRKTVEKTMKNVFKKLAKLSCYFGKVSLRYEMPGNL